MATQKSRTPESLARWWIAQLTQSVSLRENPFGKAQGRLLVVRNDNECRATIRFATAKQRFALQGLSAYAGNYRPSDIKIGGSRHKPPGAHMVPEEIEHMCDYVNDNWDRSSPVHLAAYALWKLNWIHPFTDGNGRTARAISYLLLCLRLGYRLPGTNTIPEQIAKDKRPYYKALEAADEAWAGNKIDLFKLEELLSALLANQLVSVHQQATGKKGGA